MTDQRTKRMGGFYFKDEVPYLTVTTILKVIDKSGPLMWWAAGECYDHIMLEMAKGNTPDRKSAVMAHRSTSGKAKDRGTAVHSIVEAYKNTEEVPGLTGPYSNYANAFKDWLSHHKVEVIENERTVYSETYQYAGTLDMVAKINGKLMIMDVKTGKDLYPEVPLQLSAYRQALSESGLEVDGISALLLKEDGSYKFEVYTDKLPAFLAARTLYMGLNEKKLEKVNYMKGGDK